MRPPLAIRVMGWLISRLIAHVPGAWTLLRRPTRRFWDRAAAGWDTSRRSEEGGWLAPLATAADRLPVEPRRIVDLGTGTGAAARLLARRFPEAEVMGVDLSPEMVAAAERATPPELADRVRFVVADAVEVAAGHGRFDLVAQLNLPVFFDAVATLLAPEGSVIIASSLGPATPYFTPERVVRRGLAKRGLDQVESGAAGDGTFLIATSTAGVTRPAGAASP